MMTPTATAAHDVSRPYPLINFAKSVPLADSVNKSGSRRKLIVVRAQSADSEILWERETEMIANFVLRAFGVESRA